jgi:flagellar biosynthesis/type III secretory pathway M-ring protein FliF/YscJ
MWRSLTLVCLLVCLGLGIAAGQAVGASEEAELKKLSLDERRFQLDTKRFEFEKAKYERDRGLEWGKAWAAIGSVLVTLGVGLSAYLFQIRTRKRDEALQFQLKAAEIVMDARDTNQARRKAEFLTQLFRDRLDPLDKALKAEHFPFFGRSQETKEDLLKVLAQHPESRSDIIRAWEILFPWDSTDSRWATKSDAEKNAYRWFDELKKDETLNQNRPAGGPSADA